MTEKQTTAGEMLTPEEFSLDVQLKKDSEMPDDKGWWVITCPQERGMFLCDPDLSKALQQVPAVFRLMKRARMQ